MKLCSLIRFLFTFLFLLSCLPPPSFFSASPFVSCLSDSRFFHAPYQSISASSPYTCSFSDLWQIIDDLASDYVDGKRIADAPTPVKSFFLTHMIGIKFPPLPQYYANNSTLPDRAEKKAYGLLLQPNSAYNTSALPDPVQVFTRLMMRTGDIQYNPVASPNALLMTFANFFLEDILRSDFTSPAAALYVDEVYGLVLSQVYGATTARVNILRARVNGMLRTSTINGDVYPITWSDAYAQQLVSDADLLTAFNTTNITAVGAKFVAGIERMNTHIGHMFWLTIYTREHNRLCTLLANTYPQHAGDDAFLYDTARAILTVTHTKLVVNNYIGDVISTLSPSVRIAFDVQDFLHARLFFPRVRFHVYLELNHLYHFHAMIPDVLLLPKGDTISFANMMQMPQQLLTTLKVNGTFEMLYNTPIGRLGPQNIPSFMQFVTVRAINQGRATFTASYNDYREYLELPRFKSFEQLAGVGTQLTSALQSLYGVDGIDKLELFVGMMVEMPLPYAVLSETVLRLVAPMAFGEIFSLPFLNDGTYLSEAHLTTLGLDYVTNADLQSLLAQHVDTLPDDPVLFDLVRNKPLSPAPDIYDLEWNNMYDYLGVPAIWDYLVPNSLYFYGYVTMFTEIAVVLTMYYFIRPFLMKPEKFSIARLLPHEQSSHIVYLFMSIIYIATLPYYFFLFLMFFFSPRLDLVIQNYLVSLLVLTNIHSIVYIVDSTSRLTNKQWSNILELHHILWHLEFILPSITKDVLTLKIAILLDCFSCFEFGLYMLLYLSKVKNRKLTTVDRWFGRFAVGLYNLSRVVQTILLGCLLSGAQSRMGTSWMYAVQVLISVVLTVIQWYTVWLYVQWKSLWSCARTLDRRVSTTAIGKTLRQLTGLGPLQPAHKKAESISKRPSQVQRSNSQLHMNEITAESAATTGTGTTGTMADIADGPSMSKRQSKRQMHRENSLRAQQRLSMSRGMSLTDVLNQKQRSPSHAKAVATDNHDVVNDNQVHSPSISRSVRFHHPQSGVNNNNQNNVIASSSSSSSSAAASSSSSSSPSVELVDVIEEEPRDIEAVMVGYQPARPIPLQTMEEKEEKVENEEEAEREDRENIATQNIGFHTDEAEPQPTTNNFDDQTEPASMSRRTHQSSKQE